MKKTLIISILLLTSCFCHAQKSKVDSLMAQIEKTNDIKKIGSISSELIAIPQGSMALLKQGRQDLAMAEAAGTEKGKERALLLIATATWDLRYTPQLLDASLRGARISGGLKDSLYLVQFLHCAGLANYFQQDIRKAGNYFIAAARIASAIHDTSAVM